MNLHLGTGEWIVIGICAALGIWFLAAIAVNRRLEKRLLERITGGMPGCSHDVPRRIEVRWYAVAGRSPLCRLMPLPPTCGLISRERFLFSIVKPPVPYAGAILEQHSRSSSESWRALPRPDCG
jgi:hypothetical protein